MSEREDLKTGLNGVDDAKRQTMRRMVAAAAFAVPVVASFSIDSMTISRALAGPGNGGNSTITPIPSVTGS